MKKYKVIENGDKILFVCDDINDSRQSMINYINDKYKQDGNLKLFIKKYHAWIYVDNKEFKYNILPFDIE